MATIQDLADSTTTGKRKYADPRYILPSDVPEQNRLNLQHQLTLVSMHHKLGFAPANDHDVPGTRVLDLGTGTGIWAVDYAQRHPTHQIVGSDIAAIQPKSKPANITWQIDDLDAGLAAHDSYHYIHARYLNGSVADWPALLRSIHTKLLPGGYFEIQNLDLHTFCDDETVLPTNPIIIGLSALSDATHKLGRPFIKTLSLVPILEKVGFKNVEVREFIWPWNEWPEDAHLKEVGRLMKHNLAGNSEGLFMEGLTRGAGWSRDDVKRLTKEIDEFLLTDLSQHSYAKVYVITAQKPE